MKIKLTCALLLCLFSLAAIDIPQVESIVPISVSLTGFVENPGVYQLSPINRLSDLLARDQLVSLEAVKAVSVPAQPEMITPKNPAPDSNEQSQSEKPDYRKGQALRTVQIIRNGQRQSYDLLRFYRLGELNQNPYLKDGDVVLVGAVKDFVNISGGINLPGDIQFVDGDKLGDIIALAKDLSYDADPAKVMVYRYFANRIDFEIINLSLEKDEGFALKADDRIVIPQDAEIRNKQRVKLSGQVKNPGEYVISKNVTLYEIIKQAGGLTNRSDLKNLVCYNENLGGKPDLYLEMLMQRSMSDMTPLEYSYLRTNLMQLKGKYSIDAVKLMESEGKEFNHLLTDGDHIYIPEKMDMVWVSGQVRYPGLVPWVEGKDWDYYIAAAGGYANNRKLGKGRLIRGFSGNWVAPKKNLAIMPGDTVFVPGQIDRSLWVDIKDIVTLTSSVVTIILGVRALTTR